MEDWDKFDEEHKTAEVELVDTKTSLSSGVRQMLNRAASTDGVLYDKKKLKKSANSYISIYEVAASHGLTVEEFVRQYPGESLALVENTLCSIDKLLTEGALTGGINVVDESGNKTSYEITRSQSKMIELKRQEAHDQYDLVNELILTNYGEGEQRKDALFKMMYKRAMRGNTKLAMYLIDRVDGRPAESKQVEFDYDNTYNVYAIIKTLFDKQLEVLNSGNGVKLICCSRRAGKTHLLVAMLLIECLRRPRTQVMYIGETMELSEQLVNKAANDIIDKCHLKNKRGMRFDWKHMDNGSSIMVRGLSNTKDPDQIRGKAAKVIVIDEFFHLKGDLLEYMQKEVLEPMQMDYADDYMFVCAGTPPRTKGSYGEKVWRSWKVPHFSWTWRDNPHPSSLEARTQFVEKALADKGLDWTSSYARREYNGEWAYDEDLLLYPEYHTYNSENVPNIIPSRILFGIDYGVGDNDTIWGCVWNDDEKRGYQFFETKFNRLDIMDRSISQLEYLGEQVCYAWRMALDMFMGLDPKEANKRILWDADDSDQHLTDYFNINLRLEGEDYKGLRINIANAHKVDRTIMYDRIRDTLRKGDLLIMKGSKCEQELLSTILKRGDNGEVYSVVDDNAFHPDILPAMRYAMWNAIGM